MAKLANVLYASELSRWEIESSQPPSRNRHAIPARPVIVRFCGTSDNSMDSEALMKSLRVHIEYIMGPIKRKSEKPLTNWEWFNQAIHQFPVILVIDSIDSLIDGYEFLMDINPHDDARIIISTAQIDENDKNNLFTKEKVTMLEVPKLSATVKAGSSSKGEIPADRAVGRFKTATEPKSEIEDIVEKVLASHSRRLTESQMKLVVEKVSEEPSVLYLSLACRVVQHWDSQLSAPILESSLSGIFSQIMDHIEQECGEKMSRMALSFITYSVRGINDNEMEDLLSMDDGILYTIFSYDYPGVFRVPSHVWTKLRMALSGLVVERLHGCLSWHHKDLQLLAEERYFCEEEDKQSIHRKMGCYFGDRVLEREREKKKMAAFPLLMSGASVWLDSCKPSHRRCEESAHHLINAGMLREAVEEMCNFDYICASAKCGQGFHLVSTFKRLRRELSDNDSVSVTEDMPKRVEDYLLWVERNIGRIMEAPAVMIPVTVTSELESSCARQDFMELLRRLPSSSPSFADEMWIRGVCLIPPTASHNISGTASINCVAWSPDDQKLASASDDNTAHVWDVNSGSILLTLEGHSKPVTCVDWHPSGAFVITGSRDRSAIIWNAETGAMVRTLSDGHTLDLICVAFSPDGSLIATGGKDSKVLVWDNGVDAKGNFRTFKKFNDYFVSCVKWSPDGKYLAASTYTNSVRIWDIEAKKAKVFSESTQQVSSLSWDPSGEHIVSVSDDCCASIWSPQQPTMVYRVFKGHAKPVRAVSWCPHFGRIVSGDVEGGIVLWDSASASAMVSLLGHSDCVNCIQWNNDGNKIASASKDGSIIVWDSASVEMV